MRSRFSWETLSVIDWNATACGCNKCFFPASQLSERKEEGWLVGKPKCETGLVDRGVFPEGFGCNSSSWFPQYNRTWTFAEELRTRFGVGHMLSRPPEVTTLTPAQAASLNYNLKRRVDRNNRPHWATPWNRSIPWSDRHTTKAPKRYYSPGPHPVQAVRSCPWPSCVMLGCTSLKAKAFIRGAARFFAHAPNKTKLSQGIRRNFDRVAAMAAAHPCLKLDFQVFLRNDGQVFNVDLDRCDQLELAASKHSPPLSEAFQRNLTAFQLELTRLPGLCEISWHQTRLVQAVACLVESSHLNPIASCLRRLPGAHGDVGSI